MVPMDATNTLAPLVAYYGSLIDERPHAEDEFVTSLWDAEEILPTLTRTPIAAVRPGDFQGDYVVMVQVPWILPESLGDDEYTFEVAE